VSRRASPQDPRPRCRRCQDRRRQPDRRPVDGHRRHPRPGRDPRPDPRPRRGRVRDRPDRRARPQGRRGAARDRPPLARPPDRRYPLRAHPRAEGARRRDPRPAPQPGQHPQGGGCSGSGPQGEGSADPDPDRGQLRQRRADDRGLRRRDGPARRQPARAARRVARPVGARAHPNPRGPGLLRHQGQPQGVRGAGPARGVPALRPPRQRLPPAPGSHGGRYAAGGQRPLRGGHRHAARPRHRRHDPGLADDRSEGRGLRRLRDPQEPGAAHQGRDDDRLSDLRAGRGRPLQAREPGRRLPRDGGGTDPGGRHGLRGQRSRRGPRRRRRPRRRQQQGGHLPQGQDREDGRRGGHARCPQGRDRPGDRGPPQRDHRRGPRRDDGALQADADPDGRL
ncbi:MAG: (E)-4-hydroxy-3-methylbut-2-enyl-diphosphate synthase (flavodoxin), partial [uncultured Thermomicrobiales bacterium]